MRGWAGKRISRTVHTSLVYLTRNWALLHRRNWISTGQRESITKCKETTYAIDLVWPRQTGPLRLLPPYLKSVIIACVADQYKDDMLSMLCIHTDCKYGASNHWCTVHQWFFWTLLLIGRKGNRDMWYMYTMSSAVAGNVILVEVKEYYFTMGMVNYCRMILQINTSAFWLYERWESMHVM